MKLRVRHSPNNQAPHSLKEQRYVLSKEQIAHLLPALEQSHFAEAVDVEDGIAAEDWGVQCTPVGQPVDPVVSQIVHHIAANNKHVRTHSPPGAPVLRRISIVKMDSSPASRARSRFQPQHHWHKDGGTSLVTVVFTLYDGEWDSANSPGAFALGGRVAKAYRPCGTAVHEDPPSFGSVRSGRSLTCCPLTNALCITPGQHVSHAVFKVHDPTTVRFALFFFLEPPPHLYFHDIRLPVDDYLRITWALGFFPNDATSPPLFCSRCHRLFSNQRQVHDHNKRKPNCKTMEAKKRLIDSSKQSTPTL
jgi:hypothetical protein